MTTMRLSAAGLALALAAIGAAAPRTARAEEHATAPAPLGQANKEVVVNPSGTLKDSGYGIVVQRGDPAPRSAPPPGPRSELNVSAPPTYFPPPPPAGPRGPAVVNASYITVHGSLLRIDKGKSITIRAARTGKARTVPLARNGWVAEGLQPGDAVVLQIPFGEGTDSKTADRVERQKAGGPAATSKFGQAQAGVTR